MDASPISPSSNADNCAADKRITPSEHRAVVASLIETCKLIGGEPHTYLADVITCTVNDHPNSQIDELLPWACLATQKRWRVA
jgi:transposase